MTIAFSSKSPRYAWLSNFSEHGFRLDGVHWPTVEHFYQAQKYAGTELEQQIRRAETALGARKMGQNRSLRVRADWDEVKEAVMQRALRAKFEQGRALGSRLLETGDERLEHESSSDVYWGCGSDGSGLNRLGVILMEVRATLREKSEQAPPGTRGKG